MTEKFLEFARSFIGVREKGGQNRGPEVERFQKAVDGKAQGEPWCMAWVQYCVREFGPTQLFPSEHCLTVWNKSPESLRLTAPQPGCLVIWRHAETAQGHVGIVDKVTESGEVFFSIEGNTGPGAGVVREGDGVYRRTRSIKGDGRLKIVGFLDPFVGA